ncbi:MAG TPA: hypothetical protein VH228_09830 [Nocardioides sp.]|nr:hypothetical protein [Nocardioides sp.]
MDSHLDEHPAAHADETHRVALIRAWIAGVVVFVVVGLAVRWLMREIFPNQGGPPGDFWIYVLRGTTSVAVATASGIAVGLLAYGRRS